MPDFTINENAPILVEFAETESGYVEEVALSPDDMLTKSAEVLEKAMNTIHHMARRVSSAVDALEKKPSQVEAAFGLKLNAEGNALVAKAGVEANLNIKLVWDFTGATSENR